MRCTPKILVAATVLLVVLVPTVVATPPTKDPFYIRIDGGWKGLFAGENEYAEYSLKGSQIQLQDAYHALLNPHLGIMVTFADKKEFGSGSDLLASHLRWETDYWRSHASKVESIDRKDLSGERADLKVTQFKLQNEQGKQLSIYMIALAAEDGVFVLSLSPVDQSVDPVARELAASFRLVKRKLDEQEIKKITSAIRAQH